jgi:hypothetical protein
MNRNKIAQEREVKPDTVKLCNSDQELLFRGKDHVRVARFFLVQNTKAEKNIPNGYKVNQDFPQQDLPNLPKLGFLV